MQAQLQAWLPEAIAIRQHIHQHPELGFEEKDTHALVIEKLREYGVDDIHTGFATTGIVAIIRGKLGEGKRIGLRADMDALPIHEQGHPPYRSQCDGKMHACGHDGHTAMLLLAARYLAATRDFYGEVALIFQPAEEGLGGAAVMIADGVLEKYPLDACFALHNMPGIAAGHFAFKSGAIMASSDRLFITVNGKGGHAAQPHLSHDPLLVATHIYQAIQGMVSRTFDPFDPVVVSVTQIHGGDTTNVIADYAELSGTFRTLSRSVREDLIARLQQLTPHIAQAYGMDATFALGKVSYPPTVNTANEAAYAAAQAMAVVGNDKVDPQCSAKMTGEDFAFFLEQVQGCYGFIGNGVDSAGLHQSTYNFNDDILPIGAAFFIQLVEQFHTLKP